MSDLVIQYSFSPNTTALSGQVDTNFQDVVTWANGNIDGATNISFVYASNVIPTTGAQATFGGTTAGVGYKFLAGSTTSVPLTISGVSSISVDLLDVTLTSGGTNVFKIASTGAATITGGGATVVPLTITSAASASVQGLIVNMGSSQSAAGITVNGASGITGHLIEAYLTSGGTLAWYLDSGGVMNFVKGLTPASSTQPQIYGDNGSTVGIILNIPVSSSNGVRVLTGGSAQVLQVQANGAVTSGTSGTISSGQFNWGTSAGNGLTQIGSSSSAVQTIVGSSLYLFNNNGTAFAAVDGSGNLGIAGTLHQASARSMKKNIESFSGDALRDVLAVKAYRYHFKHEEDDVEKHVGFISDEAPRSLYRQGKGPNDIAVDPYWLSVVNMVAIQQLHAKLDAILEGKLSAS
ncbi:MAG: tail fiber domain-containing protein [Candidatus Aquilonibacter sp.]|jgi:hypothetical protein